MVLPVQYLDINLRRLVLNFNLVLMFMIDLIQNGYSSLQIIILKCKKLLILILI